LGEIKDHHFAIVFREILQEGQKNEQKYNNQDYSRDVNKIYIRF